MQLSGEAHAGGVKTSEATPAACAAEVLLALPPLMWFVRRHMRSHRGRGLSVPQFRTLAMLRTMGNANLTTVADHLGASHPTTSRIVAKLVAKGLVRRRACAHDRRQLALVTTERGAAVMAVARRATRQLLARELARCAAGERVAVLQAMRSLRRLFGPGSRRR